GDLYADPWLAGLLQFLSLLPPTALMGLSLPLLARAVVTEAASASRTLGLMYGINTLGAAAGALLAPWVLVRYFGLGGAAQAAAAANALAAAIALGLALRAPKATEYAAETASPLPGGEPAGRRPLALWLALYTASGFCALSLELLWFRLLEVATRSTAFAFGTLLAIFLAGFALGALVGAVRGPRMQRPLRVFLLCQCALIAWAGVAVLLLVRLPTRFPGLQWLFTYWRTGAVFELGSARDPGALLRLYVALPIVLFGLPTALMGFSFPALQRAVQDDPATCGRKVGLLQAGNISGCVAGSLLVGLAGLSWIGSSGSLRLLMVAGAAFAAVGLAVYGRRSPFPGAAVGLLLLAAALPEGDRLWQRLHASESTLMLVAEDATSVSAIVPAGRAQWRVTVNGRQHSDVPFGGIHTRLGATPAVIHPAPADIAIVGLGSGDTAWAAACRVETRTVTVFEIAGRQQELLRRLTAREDVPQLRAFLADRRVLVRVMDGRRALSRETRRYDLIEADALWPYSAYSGNLYSVEFFRECASRLKPGGIMCTWSPTVRVRAAFRAAFPHGLMPRNGSFLMGSNQPIAMDPVTWSARAADPALRRYLGASAVAALANGLGRLVPIEDLQPDEGVRPDTDLYPRDEFLAP
ncbi:MAG TPA: fused MFS/spermidine synthase, partial [Vicinamibacteria bacterium]|nr:fused MFS/spermidine synthase [Vicinamibacteria bacterium]